MTVKPWRVHQTVARVKGDKVTLEKIERVTPSGQAKIAGRPERYYHDGEQVGARARAFIRVPTPEDIETVHIDRQRDNLLDSLYSLPRALPERVTREGVDGIVEAISALRDALAAGGAK